MLVARRPPPLNILSAVTAGTPTGLPLQMAALLICMLKKKLVESIFHKVPLIKAIQIKT